MSSTLMLLTYPYRPDPRVFREARALTRRGIKVNLIAWDRDTGERHQVDEGGVNVIRVGPRCPYRSVGKVITRLPRFWWKALRESRMIDFDVIHCHDFDTLPLGMLLSKLRGKPVLYDAHEIYSAMIRKDVPTVANIVWKKEKYISGKANELITVNESLAETLSEGRRIPAKIVRNSPDADVLDGADLNAIRQKHNLRGFVVSYLGSLEPGRFVEELTKMFDLSGKAELAIAGHGTLRPNVEKAASANAAIRFLESLDTDEALKVTWASNLVVAMLDPTNPNYKASTPVKVLDAMACGRPVVTTKGLDIAGLVESVGCGFVIPYDPKAFKETLEKAMTSPKLLEEMGRKGKEYFDRELSWEHSQDELFKAYKALVGDF